MNVNFLYPHFLWLAFLALPLAALAWRIRRKRRAMVGDLLLWRLTLEKFSAGRNKHYRHWEIILTVLAVLSATLALAEPRMRKKNSGVSALAEATRHSGFPPGGERNARYPHGVRGENQALCRAEIVGGQLFAVIGNFSAMSVTGNLEWRPAGRNISAAVLRPADGGSLVLRVPADSARAFTVPVDPDCWSAGKGHLELRWRPQAAGRDIWAADNILIAEKAQTVALDAGRFPDLANALRAAGAEIIAITPARRPAEKSIDVAVIGEEETQNPAIYRYMRQAARRALLRVATAPNAGEMGNLWAVSPRDGQLITPLNSANRPAEIPEFRLCALTPELTRTRAFPLEIATWWDKLVPPCGSDNPQVFDCRPAAVAGQQNRPAEKIRRAGNTHANADNALPWLAPALSIAAALCIAGLAISALRQRAG